MADIGGLRVAGNSRKERTVCEAKDGESLETAIFRMEDWVWGQRLVSEVPYVGSHEAHNVNAAGY